MELNVHQQKNGWRKWGACILYNGIQLSPKNKWNNAICSNIDGPRNYHTKKSKSDRETNITWYHSYLESNLKNDTNELTYRAATDSEISKINSWLPKGKGCEEE